MSRVQIRLGFCKTGLIVRQEFRGIVSCPSQVEGISLRYRGMLFDINLKPSAAPTAFLDLKCAGAGFADGNRTKHTQSIPCAPAACFSTLFAPFTRSSAFNQDADPL